jgi:hypothetical protein
MIRIVVTPTRAKLIDFETTLPGAVEEPIRRRAEHQAGGRRPRSWRRCHATGRPGAAGRQVSSRRVSNGSPHCS